MSNSESPAHDLSTVEGVRIFCFAVANLAQRLSQLNRDTCAILNGDSQRIERLVLELGGNSTEQKVSAIKAKITDFNFREPQFLGYLVDNKFLRLFLMDLRIGGFVDKTDHRPFFVKARFDGLTIVSTECFELLFDLISVADDLLQRVNENRMHSNVPCECVADRYLLEQFFRLSKGVSGGANRNRVDFRREAALRALRLERYRNANKQKILDKEKDYEDEKKTKFDRKNIIKEILENKEFVPTDLNAPSQPNQIRVLGGKLTGAVTAIQQTAQQIVDQRKKRINPGTYVIRADSPNGISRDRPRVHLVLQTETGPKHEFE